LTVTRKLKITIAAAEARRPVPAQAVRPGGAHGQFAVSSMQVRSGVEHQFSAVITEIQNAAEVRNGFTA